MSETNFKKQFPRAFPKLSDQQMRDVGEFAICKTYSDGDVLFKAGDTEFKFYVVQSGGIDIVDRSSGAAKVLLTHDAGGFTGELANLTGRAATVDAIARGTLEVYEVCDVELQHIISERPELSDLILQTFITRAQIMRDQTDFVGLRVIGARYSADTFRIRDFLTKNSVIYTYYDYHENADIQALLDKFQVGENDLPVVGYGSDWLLKNPAIEELATKLGIRHEIDRDALYDLAIVGGGPAGLAAAVYGASEGLKTLVIDQIAAGGQAATSSKIENYLGFPTGLSGAELAGRASLQARKFGAKFLIPARVKSLNCDEPPFYKLDLDDGGQIKTRALVIASGAQYRKLDVPNRERFDGAGVYYAATPMEAQMCGGDQVAVVGGGNSAGQACIYLSTTARKVFLLIRGDDLGKSMSDYLVQRILKSPNIELLTGSEITRMDGKTHLEEIEIANRKNDRTRREKVGGVFSFIGAKPGTDWLPAEIKTDEKGFIKTGPRVADSELWKEKSRAPFYLETSLSGVFAVGDVRCDSVKRVASGVGEGSMSVAFVHEYLKEVNDAQTKASN